MQSTIYTYIILIGMYQLRANKAVIGNYIPYERTRINVRYATFRNNVLCKRLKREIVKN